MKIAILTTDNRGPFKQWDNPTPWFGTAPEALLSGFAEVGGVEVHVVSCIRQPPVSSPAKLADNIWFHSLHVPKWGWMRTLYFGCLRAIRRKLREIQPDLVHGQGSELEAAFCAAYSGFPNVITLHGIMREQARLLNARVGSFYWLAARIEDLALRRTAGVFCNSQYTEESARERARRTWRVPNALRPEFFVASRGREQFATPTLLNIGVVCPRKRQLELLTAAEDWHREGMRFELQFLGTANPTGSYSGAFLGRIRVNSAFAVYVGSKSTAALVDHFDRSAALVHVPSEESFGLVVAEALARNLKVFAFGVGGVRDICAGVEGAELFTDGDWAGLKAAVRRWLEAGAPRPTTAASAMRERYHPVVIATRHLGIYREVLGW